MAHTVFKNVFIHPAARRSHILVQDGKIEAIDPADDHAPDYEGAKVIDLDGAFVYPGFRDAHCHLLSTAEAALGLDASNFKSLDSLIEAGRQAIASGGVKGIYAKRLNETHFAHPVMPKAEDLDRISEDLPVIVVRVCGHLASVNSRVLKDIPELAERAPDGVVLENDIDLLPSLRSFFTKDDLHRALKQTIEYMLSKGITAISSNDLGRFGKDEDEALLDDVLSLFPGFSYRSQYAPHLPFDPKELEALADVDGIKPAVKVFRDGSLGGKTAWLRKPYSDDKQTSGQDTLDDETHRAVFETANRLGLQVMTHAIGDEALSRTLDILEAVSDPLNPLRHAIVHAQVTDDRLISRMRNLALAAIVQPLFTRSDSKVAKRRLGTRYRKAYDFKQMANMGVKVAFSSDAPVEPLDPLLTLQAALRGKPGDSLSAFSFDEALLHQTKEAAFIDFEEENTGMLAVGFDADFAAFDRDLRLQDARTISDAKCVMTVTKGHVWPPKS